MTYQREVSLAIQNQVGAVVLRDRTPPLVKKYFRRGMIDVDGKIEFLAVQQRPYTTVFLQAVGEPIWSVGHSKCIGVHNDNKPDEWNAKEGLRLAIARAASSFGAQKQHYSDVIIAGNEMEMYDYE